ncbi:MAG: indole-3-glycerol-phosphate synthase [Thaumarchaeota archaeon]|jgi:indole-3-glycerol phosphate synthase|nr:indole-3-glycerol-phosphate synthase [Candidatus Terraquivivens yellowstonensis]MCL7398864.1 indole-3-glycerol-phosphate synthase [Candidatus Terraquivivens yellowstonensis]
MGNFLKVLVEKAIERVKNGYYDILPSITFSRAPSLKGAILSCKAIPIIAELKQASPTMGWRVYGDVKAIVKAMEHGGAVGISVLTEKEFFDGSLEKLRVVRETVSIPILMKDIIVNEIQLRAASRLGASAVLLIKKVYDQRMCGEDLDEMIKIAHSLGLEVLLETHTEEEFLSGMDTEADMLGINNRDLETLRVDVGVSERILSNVKAKRKPVVCESGISSPDQVILLKNLGADAFLIGTSIMTSADIESKVREFVRAYDLRQG